MAIGDPVYNRGKTLGGMRTRLIRELGNRTDLEATLLNEWINDSYRDLASALDLPELKDSLEFTTTAGEESYELPSGVGVVRGAAWRADTLGRALEKRDEDYYRKLPFREGTPEIFVHTSNLVVFWPVPSDAQLVTLDITRTVVNLTEDLHSPIISEAFHEALYLGAKARGFDALKDWPAADRMENAQVKSIRKKLDKKSQEDEGKTFSLRPVRRKQDRLRLDPRAYNRDEDIR